MSFQNPYAEEHPEKKRRLIFTLAAYAPPDEVISAMEKCRFDPLSTDSTGNTVMHVCARYNREKTAIALMEAGISPSVQNGEGKLPADVAGEKGFSNLARVLRSMENSVVRGVSVTPKEDDGIQMSLF